jgi:hypothetical protein
MMDETMGGDAQETEKGDSEGLCTEGTRQWH